MNDATRNASLPPVIAEMGPGRGDRSPFALEQAQAVLLARLHDRPDDFAATTELQEVNALSARLKSRIPPLERDQLVHQGLSSVERTRIWLRSKIRSRRRDAGTVAAAGPGAEAPPTPASRRGVMGGASPRQLATAPMMQQVRRDMYLHAGGGAAMTTGRVQ
jgi:hypothetical protein